MYELIQSLNKVFILNHFQSTISVINSITNTVNATINLPLAEGRQDAIAVMCYDKFLQKIFVSFPEFGNIVKINAVTNAVESTTPIPDILLMQAGEVSELFN